MTQEIKCPKTGQAVFATVIGKKTFCNNLDTCPHQCPLCPNVVTEPKEFAYA